MIVDPHYTMELLDPSESDNHFLLTVRAQGLEDTCEVCAVHVQKSTSCTEPMLGEELWNSQFHHRDPWELVHYTTSQNGRTHIAIPIFTGDSPERMEGHVLRLDDSQG